MKQKSRRIDYQVCADRGELPADEAHLLEQAWLATERAHAPYSQFSVGCAVLLSDGRIIQGNNQENRAYPSGLCAERTALFHIGSLGDASLIQKIAIRARSTKTLISEPAMPCGSCCQVMVEYEQLAGHNFIVLSQGETGSVVRVNSVRNSLLPFSFDIEF